MIKDLITRRGAMRTAGAAVLTTMGMAAKSRPSNEIERLWEARAALMGRCRKARKEYDAANARLPDWAKPGPSCLNSKGERCGPVDAAAAIDALLNELGEVEQKIVALRDGASPAWLAAAAIVEIGQETTLDNTIDDASGMYFHRAVLEAVVDQLSGRLATDTKAILRGAPFGESGCYC